MPSRCGAPLPHTLWTGPMRGKSPTEEMGQPQSIMALGELRDGPLGDEGARRWQEDLPREWAKERSSSSRQTHREELS